ncbi:PocR ligand-binding domain-containing protein [Lutibacter sp.]|uniref:PocR ligand-binding domain-containing protein n=1 Tax=Lutibacter sp. TaxID=1925666 RepID=UPI001A33A0D6|nr:PocR ligand-binding domain-containing protein [Lutibacter sp.]MBI9041532.1 PocR ligand-binding domain-containing protein [Lutibacter sp.]
MNYKLQDFIDSERINVLLDLFHKTTGFLTAILDLEGNVLSKSGWREICTDFHRVNSKTCEKCFVSDTMLSKQMAEGEKYHAYECLNGLVDVAVPIIIDGEHLGNLFTGQFLFKEPNLDFFRNQAKQYGYNEETYMNALKKVPIVSKDDAKTAMDFLLNMTLLFCDITKQKMVRKQSEQALLKEKQYLEAVFNSLSEGIVSCDEHGILNRFNNATMEFHGLPKEPIPANEWANHYNLYHPDGITPMQKEDIPLFKALKDGIIKDTEITIIPKNGEAKTFITNGQRVIDSEGNSLGAVVAMHDITQHKEAEKELKNYQEHLEEIIKERTSELEEKNKKLDKLNKVFVGRELRMAELKNNK